MEEWKTVGQLEKGKGGNMCKRKIYCLQRRRKSEKEEVENIWTRKMFFVEDKDKMKIFGRAEVSLKF